MIVGCKQVDIFKGMFVAHFGVPSPFLLRLRKLMETSVVIVGKLADIRTMYILSESVLPLHPSAWWHGKD
jgi:hypothetical protein